MKHIKFYIIFIAAIILRIYGLTWDQGMHLHPDERMLIMVADRIHFFTQMNPDFFNYGSLPIYFLKVTAQLIDIILGSNVSTYDGMLMHGRYLSIIAEGISIIYIYKLVRKLFPHDQTNKIALYSSCFYAISFFLIQNSHFFTVDIFLNCFTIILMYLLLRLDSHPRRNDTLKMLTFIGIIFGAMLSTKITAIIFLPIICLTIFLKNYFTYKNIPKVFKYFFLHFIFFISIFLATFFVFMPYAFINAHQFITEIKQQLQMNNDPYIFPYTLQYVGTLPYVYYLKNIFFWGLGPVISILSIIGITLASIKIIKSYKNYNFTSTSLSASKFLIFILFYLIYFLIIGKSSVKFMRYMLPIYPFFIIMAGYGLEEMSKVKCQMSKIIPKIFILAAIIWTFMFVNIYSTQHTRITASNWINQNIPSGSSIAVEHWDDRLPLLHEEIYNINELPFYNLPDNQIKWQEINSILIKSDYIIIASNRLYIPLQKLSDCSKYSKCYPITSEYYKRLFNNQMGFKKIAEFSSPPHFQIFNMKFDIDDSSADESFTVYDHPKIFIFKKD